MKRYVAVALLLILLPSAFGKAVYPDRLTLKGLKKLHVLVEVGTEAESAGLSTEQLKTDVELRLRRAHLPVVDHTLAYLYVNVHAISTQNGWAYSILVSLDQSVTLDRNKSISCFAETWHQRMLGMVPAREFVSTVRENVGDKVDKFINDYLAENQGAN